MSHSRADVLTPHAGRYLSQLSKHWGHKFPVTFDETTSRIAFPGAECRLTAQDGLLVAEVEAPEADLARMQGVVADHLNRFAFREGELTFVWKQTV